MRRCSRVNSMAPDPPDRVDYATALTGATLPAPYASILDSSGFRMTAEASVDAVRAALDAYLDPYLQETLGSAQAVREVRAAGGGVAARIVPGCPIGGAPAQATAARGAPLAPAGTRAPLAARPET